jgi:hypothetical protein
LISDEVKQISVSIDFMPTISDDILYNQPYIYTSKTLTFERGLHSRVKSIYRVLIAQKTMLQLLSKLQTRAQLMMTLGFIDQTLRQLID